MDEVEEFIARRWSRTDADWCNGNCYWFSYILCERFPYLKIYYEPVIGHFVAGDGFKYYDARGFFTQTERLELLDNIKINDELWYKKLMRDSRN